MSKMITIVGQGGGNGRSTTAVNLSASLALMEKKTLLVDCDPLAGSTLLSGFDTPEFSCDLSSVLLGKVALTEAVFKTRLRFMDILPSSFNLFHAAARLSRNGGNERILRIFLRELRAEYDYMIIDPPASYSFLTVMAMAAGDWLIIPFHCDSKAPGDFRSLLSLVHYVKKKIHPHLKIAGILFNQCRSRKEIDLFLKKSDLKDIDKIVYTSFIIEDRAIKISAEKGMPVVLHDIEAPSSRAYLNVANEIISFFNFRDDSHEDNQFRNDQGK